MNLHEFLDQEEQVEQEAFEIKDDQAANWALRKIKQLKEQQEENTALAEAEISKIEAWLQSVNGEAQGSIDYFQGLLAKYAMSKRESDPKFKSKKLPNGAVRFKKQQPKWHYDDKKLVESLKESGETDLIRIKEEPNKTALKKLFVVQEGKVINPGTGEVIEGVTVEEREDKFEVVTE
ncbi:host-nuclease inhibitor Gam family protein [Oceanobacillus indicireducens]|uniref:Phage protein n=1 Tax=Oceanobacillus indicireducens TaxID=1004261 RepID=A0A917Y4C9_9BACI|nr:host-nuclease inhibitor Gam family protein [Oceanobacillus indicireducens]GGN66348.1 phage protein [Oceanobacillus indicireducens]